MFDFGVIDRMERAPVSNLKRRLVSKSELLKLVNDRGRELSSNGAGTLASVLRLSWPDDDGCNWQPGSIKGAYTEEIFQAIRESQAKYNLEDRQAKCAIDDDL